MRFPAPAVSRRKKNRSTISRSRSLASWAERRVVLGVGGDASNTTPKRRCVPKPGYIPLNRRSSASRASSPFDNAPSARLHFSSRVACAACSLRPYRASAAAATRSRLPIGGHVDHLVPLHLVPLPCGFSHRRLEGILGAFANRVEIRPQASFRVTSHDAPSCEHEQVGKRPLRKLSVMIPTRRGQHRPRFPNREPMIIVSPAP
jgi:hypothetical protein